MYISYLGCMQFKNTVQNKRENIAKPPSRRHRSCYETLQNDEQNEEIHDRDSELQPPVDQLSICLGVVLIAGNSSAPSLAPLSSSQHRGTTSPARLESSALAIVLRIHSPT